MGNVSVKAHGHKHGRCGHKRSGYKRSGYKRSGYKRSGHKRSGYKRSGHGRRTRRHGRYGGGLSPLNPSGKPASTPSGTKTKTKRYPSLRRMATFNAKRINTAAARKQEKMEEALMKSMAATSALRKAEAERALKSEQSEAARRRGTSRTAHPKRT